MNLSKVSQLRIIKTLHLAPQPSPTLMHLFGVKISSHSAELSVGAGWPGLLWADVRNAHASATTKMKVKSLAGPILT